MLSNLLFKVDSLKALFPRMLCTQFIWTMPSDSREEDKNVNILRQNNDAKDKDDRQRTNLN